MERDLISLDCHGKICVISTHTLTWSVTYRYIREHKDEDISTHTLTWSVTIRKSYLHGKTSISTHTLTWSVTGGWKRNWKQ